MADSTKKPRSWKAADPPKKPCPDFTLYPPPLGYWAKKILGKMHYFRRRVRRVNGKLEDIPGDGWEEALALHKAQADELHAGRTPRVKCDGVTVTDVYNRFLTAK